MMRTPFLVLARASADRMFWVSVGERRVQGDEIGAREKIVELDLLHADILARSGDRKGS